MKGMEQFRKHRHRLCTRRLCTDTDVSEKIADAQKQAHTHQLFKKKIITTTITKITTVSHV